MKVNRFLAAIAQYIKTKQFFLFAIIIFLSNFFFKSIYLDYSPYWYDEIISLQSAWLDFGHIKHVSEWDKNPPFYYYCLSIWVKLFNDYEYTTRLLSVIFSSISAILFFIFLNKNFNIKTAIIGSIMFISSNTLYYYSHEARAYSLVLMLALLSTNLYFLLKEKHTLMLIIALGFVNFLLIYTHYISGLVIFFQLLLAFLFFNKKGLKYYLYSCCIILLLVFLRFTKKQFYTILDFNKTESEFWLQKASFNQFKETIFSFFNNEYLFYFILILFFTLLFTKFTSKRFVFNFAIFYCILIGIGSIVILFILGQISSIFLDRYLIFSIPFLYAIFSYLLSYYSNTIISIITSVYFITSLIIIDFKTEKSMNYRDAVKIIEMINSDDLVVVKTKDIKPLFNYYASNKQYFNQNQQEIRNKNIIYCNDWNDLKSYDLNMYKRIIIFNSFYEFNNSENEFYENLKLYKKKSVNSEYYKGIRLEYFQ